MTKAPLLRGVHHCHLQVKDMEQALAFYRTVMGFEIVPELEFWYHHQDDGPLMLQDQAKTICLALFMGNRISNGIAFAADALAFVHWVRHLEEQGVKTTLADHQVSHSLYFRDPSANMHEITCFEYEAVQKLL
ncbi:VOC family protein [Pseudoalteromonas sp. T1lg75]|uniref:VOC family protein n=1 Tax=Pseudoalteromonas sp. T1lg75 TaxID=2077102 RepID=UPI000CF64E69|nr:VOC family protein [Pseudoalteromonas sp. T1lg75]